MVRYCQSCGRQTPNDASLCPYCGAQIDYSKAPIIQEPKKEKEGKLALIILIIFVVAIVVTIAIAATVYVYVSGMLGPISDTQIAPNIEASVNPDLGNNATLIVTYIDKDDVYWPYISFEIYDQTDGEYLTEYIDYTTDLSYKIIESGDSIKFSGQGNEFQEDHYYSMTLLYTPTGQTICYYSWDQ